ncbi:hypothetical protein ILYODFUR_005701 [Ilyodon furcidens]|uniref:Uncharacterized protein n=1 Tax=Ilyodon furcidens TaxID=33524 RepID=A0ABV0VBE4_9TELE
MFTRCPNKCGCQFTPENIRTANAKQDLSMAGNTLSVVGNRYKVFLNKSKDKKVLPVHGNDPESKQSWQGSIPRQQCRYLVPPKIIKRLMYIRIYKYFLI